MVGAETPVTVTVANGEDAPVRNLRVSLSGRNATVEEPERVAATLPTGAERAFNFTATPAARDAAVTATLRYVTAEGNDRTVTRTLDLRADPLRDDVRVDASAASEGGSPPVMVDVSNFGNAPLTDVTVAASTRVAYSPNPARIELTGISVEREGDHLLGASPGTRGRVREARSPLHHLYVGDGRPR